jgi:hypothetical protein
MIGSLPEQMAAHVFEAQGCQMVNFKTKNPNLGKFWRILSWKTLVYFMAIWSISRPSGIFYGHLIYFPPFSMFYQEKSCNPDRYVSFIKINPATLLPAPELADEERLVLGVGRPGVDFISQFRPQFTDKTLKSSL